MTQFGQCESCDVITETVDVLERNCREYDALVRRLLNELQSLREAPQAPAIEGDGRSRLQDELLIEKVRCGQLTRENRLLHQRLHEMQTMLKSASEAPDYRCQVEVEAELAGLRTEAGDLRRILELREYDYGMEIHDDIARSSAIMSPSQPSSSFLLTTPPRSPPVGSQPIRPRTRRTQDSSAITSPNPNESVMVSQARPIITDEPMDDIADVGPPMSPPSSSKSPSRAMSPVEELEAERSDREDLKKGTLEVEHDLGRD